MTRLVQVKEHDSLSDWEEANMGCSFFVSHTARYGERGNRFKTQAHTLFHEAHSYAVGFITIGCYRSQN